MDCRPRLLGAPARVLRFGSGVQCLAVGLFEQPLELRHAIVLGDLRGAFGRFLADFLGLLVEFFVFAHAINLVSAFAVKSTMGTTRA